MEINAQNKDKNRNNRMLFRTQQHETRQDEKKQHRKHEPKVNQKFIINWRLKTENIYIE